MAKVLVSWLAFNSDFSNGMVDNNNSPNYLMHKHFYEQGGYSRHIILSSEKEDDTRLSFLVNAIKKDFADHAVEKVHMSIFDVIDLPSIQAKIDDFLLGLRDHEIDIFFSPGTSVMQLAWYISHTSLALKSRLLQMRPALKTKTGKPELVEMIVSQSDTTHTTIIRESKVGTKAFTEIHDKNYVIGDSIKPVYERALHIARMDRVKVLITGETGTGKEHLAHYIHRNSSRSGCKYVAINCSAFTDELLESRLFGHTKGSFTGAASDHKGLFKEAEGGTIFLDEIGDISPYMQQSLLRVLQENEITPIGGIPRKINTRVIAATNKDLFSLCKAGKFRWDLYYRLAVSELHLPNLQSRGDKEFKELIRFFVKQKKKELLVKEEITLSKNVMEVVLCYGFPGNIRELENLIESFYTLGKKDITIAHLPERLKSGDNEKSLRWQDVEKAHIQKVLIIMDGNQAKACRAMGYGSINTLKKKIQNT